MSTLVIGAIALVAGLIGGWFLCERYGTAATQLAADVKKDGSKL